jgi:hypothetical protein
VPTIALATAGPIPQISTISKNIRAIKEPQPNQQNNTKKSSRILLLFYFFFTEILPFLYRNFTVSLPLFYYFS